MTLPTVLRRAKSASRFIARHGLRYSFHMASICILVPAALSLVPWAARIYLMLRGSKRRLLAPAELSAWKKRWDSELLDYSDKRCATLEALGLNSDQKMIIEHELAQSSEVELGPIDQDGFLLPRFNSITAIPTISTDDFLPRKRFDLRLVVLQDGVVGIKKCFNGNYLCFLSELEILVELATTINNVPRILNVDFDSLTIIISFIPGAVFREVLVERGARIRDRDFDQNPAIQVLAREQRRLERIAVAKEVLDESIDSRFIEQLFDLVQKVHSQGVILFDIKYGNIIVQKDSGIPFLIDFDRAIKIHNARGWLCRYLRDHDIEEFNLHFGTKKPTYARLKSDIQNQKTPASSNRYSPAYLGSGLRTGPIWNSVAGYGRWQYILKSNLPYQNGSRILDLGTNNGVYAMELLRRGAVEVVGVELNETRVAEAEFVKAALEWSDNTKYEFRILQANMIDVVSMDLGRFDMVMALCSIYYLEDDEISKLVKHVSSITNCFAWQCNLEQDINRKNEHVYQKASTNYAIKSLQQNGFPVIRKIAPQGYSRPLIIGTKM